MKVGFAKRNITPPFGLELGGYAGYRPNSGVHDPLWCKAVLLEQDGVRYALVVLDLMCADESLCHRIGQEVAELGITQEHLVVAAIHSHAASAGVFPGEGALKRVNEAIVPENPAFVPYMEQVVQAAVDACREAAGNAEAFTVRAAREMMPPIGSERHTGVPARGELTALQMRTESGKKLILYNLPCHPTVLSAANLQVSADFAGSIEALLDADMAVFVNGAAGDISTRFTRREQSFAECERMGNMVADRIRALLKNAPERQPQPLKGLHRCVQLKPRPVVSVETAQQQVEETTLRWQQAVEAGEDAATVRILKSYVEGAGVNLDFARTMGGIEAFHVPVTAFSFGSVNFVTVPGEFYSTLLPENTAAICYANGYYRYIADENAYDSGHYEAMAAIVARGGGEYLQETIRQMLEEIKQEENL